MAEMTAEQMARRWIELYNDGTPDTYGSDRFLDLYADDIDWREMPTSFAPAGRSGNLAILRKGLNENNGILRNRTARLHEVLAEGDRAVMRYTWEATIGVDGGLAPRGTVLRSEVVQFITVADGKIVRSYEYPMAFSPA